MSDFPTPDSYKHPHADGLNRHLRSAGIYSDFPIIIKREKGAFIYDIDDNKYVDFFLNNGTVIFGHNYGTLTKFIKNGLSVGSGKSFINKFHYRLLQTLHRIINFQTFALYSGITSALNAILHHFKPIKIGVTSRFIFDLVNLIQYNIENRTKVDLISSNQPSGKYTDNVYDLLLFEPLDFDGNLSDINPANYSAKIKISVENRTGFRFSYGFLCDFQQCDAILSAGNIANGMDVAVVFWRNSCTLRGENIPIYQTVAVNESLKLYLRKINYSQKFPKIRSDQIVVQRGSLFKLKNNIDTSSALSHGIILKDNIGFMSRQHTLHDIRRLERWLTTLK